MTLKEKITNDLSASIKKKIESSEETDNLKLILGKVQRLPDKNPTDKDVVRILKHILKSENTMKEKNWPETPGLVKLVESYLPKMASDEDTIKWIEENIDFEHLNNKMMAIKDILKHFGASTNGSVVKKILMEKF